MEYFSYYKDIDSNITYTCDMIRLSIRIINVRIKDLIIFLNSCIKEEKDFWTSTGFGKFSMNWKIGSIWVGLGTQQKHESADSLFCIEFNPNKASIDDLAFFHSLSKRLDYMWKITRFDLACDIPYNINDLKILNLSKRNYSIFYHNHNDKTIYFGSGDGHTKIYNKKIESNLDYELTRVEVTKYCDFFLSSPGLVNFNFPELAFEEYTYDQNQKSDTLDAIQYALNHGFHFTSLSRVYKSYFRSQLKFTGKLQDDFANKAFFECLHKLRGGNI